MIHIARERRYRQRRLLFAGSLLKLHFDFDLQGGIPDFHPQEFSIRVKHFEFHRLPGRTIGTFVVVQECRQIGTDSFSVFVDVFKQVTLLFGCPVGISYICCHMLLPIFHDTNDARFAWSNRLRFKFCPVIPKSSFSCHENENVGIGFGFGGIEVYLEKKRI